MATAQTILERVKSLLDLVRASGRLSRRTLTVGGAALAVVLIGALGLWLWLGAREQAASAAYLPGLLRAQRAQAQGASAEAVATAMVDLETALARYPSARQAGMAAYELGNLRYRRREYDRARAAYEQAAARTLTPTVRPLVLAGIGYTWEEQKQYRAATEAYQQALDGLKPGEFIYESLLLDLARVQELDGKKDAAIETYRRALRELPRGARAGDVRSRLATLGVSP